MKSDELFEVQRHLFTASEILRKQYDTLTTDEVILFSDITCARAKILEILWQK